MNSQRPAYYSIEDFPPLKDLVTNWNIIRNEFQALQAPVMNIDRTDKEHEAVLEEVQDYIGKGNEYGWTMGWGKSGPNKDWVQYGLIIHDEVIPYVSERLSQTIGFLRKIKGIKIAALVTMHPQSSLPCHQHPELFEQGLLQLHLPVETATVNNYAYLNVNGEFRQHVCGQPIIFDGSLDHFALNKSGANRTILYLEFDKNLVMTGAMNS
ncbi:MAG: aspartyl/Asparaginyl beta-hydroxylase family protein [Bacteroidetes bacterium]|jgi:beta-hydroxylase|nr:aspartyl/Asparaginyl beta-hydroxylase family protein [Bacteroidota bacterium]